MNPRAERIKARFQWPLIIAAILVIPAIALQQSETGAPWGTMATVLNWGIWLVFAAEFFAMLAVVDSRRQYLRDNPLDLAIVVLTPPILPASMQAARVVRLLSLLRLIKAASILRGLLSSEGVRDASVLALFIVLGGGGAFAAVEKAQGLSTWDGVWWAMTTVTTVGYGDISPATDAGRVIAMTVMLVGIGFVALLTAAAAERFIKGAQPEAKVEHELAQVNERLRQLELLLEAQAATTRRADSEPGP